MSDLTEVVEWESSTVRLVKLGGLPRSPNFPYNYRRSSRYIKIPGRKIRGVVIHHAAGNPREGSEAARRIAQFHSSSPRFNAGGKRIGGGNGWPGIGYPFVVPARPVVQDGRFVVYRCFDDEWKTWHSGGAINKDFSAIVVSGWYTSRHSKKNRGEAEPTPEAMHALQGLAIDYLLPRYDLEVSDETLLGHFDVGKVTCPGDAIENWIRTARGEDTVCAVEVPAKLDERGLDTVREIQEALVALGYDPGVVDGEWGPYTASALKAFQKSEGLMADGVFGPRSERAMRVAFARN